MGDVNKRSMKIFVDGTEFTDVLTEARFTGEDGDNDTVTFADAAAGGTRLYKFTATAKQDGTANSFWDMWFSRPGDTVVVLLKPYGNTAASPSQPHFSGNAVISEPDGDQIGGEADASVTAKQTFAVEWDLEEKYTRVTS